MKTKNVIEINGKLYDAHTGKLADGQPKTSQKNATTKTRISPENKTKHSQPANKVAKKDDSPQKTNSEKKTHKAAPNTKTRVQKSKTLNRSAVAAPNIELESGAMPRFVEAKKDAQKRLDHAMKVAKSQGVTRFAALKPSSEIVLQEGANKPTAKEPVKNESNSVPTKTTAKSTHHEALKKEAPKSKKLKKHASFAGYGATAAAVLVLAAYVTYLNVPSVSMKVAASRAGFSASLPGYKPAGYSFSGPIKYSPGLVTINFSSNSDQRNFSVTQQPTKWDTLALKENYVEKQAQYEPLTQQYNGLTVYLYDGKAAWVNAEKLFTIDTKGSQLGVDQMLKLAASM
jgi:hypothetical protein